MPPPTYGGSIIKDSMPVLASTGEGLSGLEGPLSVVGLEVSHGQTDRQTDRHRAIASTRSVARVIKDSIGGRAGVQFLVEGEFAAQRLVFLGLDARVDEFLGGDELQLNLVIHRIVVITVRVVRLRYVHVCNKPVVDVRLRPCMLSTRAGFS